MQQLEINFKKKYSLDVKYKSLGGRSVIIIFPDKISRDKAVVEQWLVVWLHDVKPWMGEPASDGKICLDCMLRNAF